MKSTVKKRIEKSPRGHERRQDFYLGLALEFIWKKYYRNEPLSRPPRDVKISYPDNYLMYVWVFFISNKSPLSRVSFQIYRTKLLSDVEKNLRTILNARKIKAFSLFGEGESTRLVKLWYDSVPKTTSG